MIRFRILRLDDGGGAALAWAKAQVRRLANAGIGTFSRTWPFGTFTVQVRAVEFSGDVIARISIFGTSGALNRLYKWPAVTTLCNFALSPLPTDPAKAAQVPASARVMEDPGKLLTALDAVLAFDVKTVGGDYVAINNAATQVKHFYRLTAAKQWFLRQWFAEAVVSVLVDRAPGDANESPSPPPRPAPLTQTQLLALKQSDQDAYTTGVAYWRVLLPITFDDCFMSQPDANGDVYVLLGQFQATAADGLQHFRGVVVSTATLFAANLAVNGITADLSSYNTNLTPTQRAAIRMLGPSDYTRAELNIAISDASGFFSDLWLQRSASPFSVVYLNLHQDVLIESHPAFPDTFPIHERTLNRWTIWRHTLGALGVIAEGTYDYSTFEAPFTAHFQAFGFSDAGLHSTNTLAAVENPVVANTGDGLVKVGELSYTGDNYLGGNGNATGTVTLRALTPFSGNQFPPVSQYIGEYSLVRAGANVARVGSPYKSITYNPSAGVDGNYAWLLGPLSPFLHDRVSTDGATETIDDSGSMLSISGGIESATCSSGLPILPAPSIDGGIFWYRDGPTGVFLFQVPLANQTARAADCAKYQNVFNQAPGYRDAVKDALGNIITPAEPGFEPLDTILARIVAATTVLANNFASQAMLPWVSQGLVGIIL